MEGLNINGHVYGWNDVTAIVAGVPIVGITAISYKDEQVIENVYGAGKFPIGEGTGQVTFDGSITLLKEEVEALVNGIGSRRLQDYAAFPIIVQFMPEGGTNIVTNVLKNVRFKSNGVDVKKNDTSVEVQIPLKVGGIAW